ncbi:DUF2778 domain-containing protein [Erwinia sp. E602]|nr:DUF2778 domain-containing protein [Erwinia sp. E602]
MTWEHSQRTGELTHNGQRYAQGYSGKDSGKNNPSMDDVSNTGPIPKGHYRISGYDNHKGPWTI